MHNPLLMRLIQRRRHLPDVPHPVDGPLAVATALVGAVEHGEVLVLQVRCTLDGHRAADGVVGLLHLVGVESATLDGPPGHRRQGADEAVARAALLRAESRGAHTREDFPGSDPEWGKFNLIVNFFHRRRHINFIFSSC